jgi:hypothetical protein
MRRTMACGLIAAGACVLASCGEGAGDDARPAADAASPVDAVALESTCEGPAQSGSRLRAIGLDAGGERWSTGWLDTELGEECVMRTASDGVLRCLPARLGDRVYLDAACTQPAAAVSDLPMAGDRMTVPVVGDACAPRFEVRVIGAGIEGQRHQLDSAGRCIATSTFSTHFPLGDEVPASAFVGTAATRVGTGDVQQVVETGSDGSRWCSGLVDRAGAACSPYVAADGALRCLPGGAEARPTRYVDAACTRMAARRRDTCEAALAVYDDVPVRRRVFPVVGPATEVYEVAPRTGECVPALSSPADALFEIGAELPASAFPPLELELPAGAGRLRARVVVDGAGVRARHGHPWDTQRDEACGFQRTRDGLVRCAPTDQGFVETRFRDGACTQSIGLVFGLALGGAVPRYGLETGVPAGRIFELGAPIAGPFYQGQPGNCHQTIDAPSALPVGAEVPPDQLALATEYR